MTSNHLFNININLWRYSPEEPRLAEVVADLNFSFLNQISLLLISSSYPIVLTRFCGPPSRPYTTRKISRVKVGIEPETLGWQSDVLTTVPNRCSVIECVNKYNSHSNPHNHLINPPSSFNVPCFILQFIWR